MPGTLGGGSDNACGPAYAAGMAHNPATDSPSVDPLQPRPGEAARTEAPAAQGVGPTSTEAAHRPLPSAGEIADAMQDASGDAVSSQPFDTEPADLADARDRVTWDADTDQG